MIYYFDEHYIDLPKNTIVYDDGNYIDGITIFKLNKTVITIRKAQSIAQVEVIVNNKKTKKLFDITKNMLKLRDYCYIVLSEANDQKAIADNEVNNYIVINHVEQEKTNIFKSFLNAFNGFL